MTTWEMSVDLLTLILPSVFSSLFFMLQEFVNLFFIGYLHSSAKIAAVGMANTIQNMLGGSIFMGMNGALNTFVSHAAGAKQYDYCLAYLYRGKVVILLCFVPVALLLSQSDKILVLLGQDPDVAVYAHQYNLIFLPATLVYGLNDTQKRYLNCLRKNKATFYI
mmetsp:Transcript_13298/g.22584  ORF Transcript_13298/g.22584 Transcript_13298/m.22584 type:complete len:164 (-) Transcript_13298:1019-1510(-)